MMFALRLRTNGDIDIIGVPEDKDWRWYSRQIGCDLVEIVHPMGLESPRVLICDEEGLLKERPVINFLGSWLYETQRHGNPIVGDVLIMEEYDTAEGGELDGMEKIDAVKLVEELRSHLWEAVDAVKIALGQRLRKGGKST